MFEILLYKVPYEKFQKTKFQDEMIRFWCDSNSRPLVYESNPLPLRYFSCRVEAKKKNYWGDKSLYLCLNSIGESSILYQIWIFKIFHRVPYFVGFQTKRILTLWGINFYAVKVFPMSFWCSFDFCSTYYDKFIYLAVNVVVVFY